VVNGVCTYKLVVCRRSWSGATLVKSTSPIYWPVVGAGRMVGVVVFGFTVQESGFFRGKKGSAYGSMAVGIRGT